MQRAVGHGLRAAIRRGRVGEAALVRAAQRGSEDAVEELFNRHWAGPIAPRCCRPATAPRRRTSRRRRSCRRCGRCRRFDLRRPLRPWLHRIVVNRAIDWSRARALRNEVGADVAAEPAAPDVAAFGVSDDIAAALTALGPEQRAVVVMRYVLELTPGEIACGARAAAWDRQLAAAARARRARRRDRGARAMSERELHDALRDAGARIAEAAAPLASARGASCTRPCTTARAAAGAGYRRRRWPALVAAVLLVRRGRWPPPPPRRPTGRGRWLRGVLGVGSRRASRARACAGWRSAARAAATGRLGRRPPPARSAAWATTPARRGHRAGCSSWPGAGRADCARAVRARALVALAATAGRRGALGARRRLPDRLPDGSIAAGRQRRRHRRRRYGAARGGSRRHGGRTAATCSRTSTATTACRRGDRYAPRLWRSAPLARRVELAWSPAAPPARRGRRRLVRIRRQRSPARRAFAAASFASASLPSGRRAARRSPRAGARPTG